MVSVNWNALLCSGFLVMRQSGGLQSLEIVRWHACLMSRDSKDPHVSRYLGKYCTACSLSLGSCMRCRSDPDSRTLDATSSNAFKSPSTAPEPIPEETEHSASNKSSMTGRGRCNPTGNLRNSWHRARLILR